MIKVSNVSKIYKDKTESVIALDNLSLQLPNKGFVGLAGENGCGKTTFLNLLSTLDSDFEGDIYIDNLNVRDNKEYIRKKVISFVFQENLFIKNLTSSENILLINSQSNLSQFHYFDINDKKDKYTNELSGGQKQKVSLIRGLEKDFDILLVDEPTSSLDEHTTKQVFELLSNISKDKLVILVSHDMEMMNAYCNLIIRLNGGKLEYIKENNTISDVIYDETGVTFYGEVNLHSISIEKMNDILENNKQFVIKKELLKQKSCLDFKEKKYEVAKTDIDKCQQRLMWKSYFKNSFARNIIFSLIICVFLLIFEIFFDFRFFNSNDFWYETLSKNQNSYLICDQDVVDTNDQILTKNTLNNFANEYSTSIDYSRKISTDNSYEFNEFSIYKSFITSITYTDFKNFNFIEGEAPIDSSKIAISDYVADALIIAQSKYSTYFDIVEKGIMIGEQNISISGIIDTDYEKYNKEELSDREFIDFSYYYQNLYSSIFQYNSFTANEYEAFFINGADSFVKIKIDNSIQKNTCKVNNKLASLLDYTGDYDYHLKTIYGEFIIRGIVDDESDQCNIYFTDDIKNTINSDVTFDSFMINISNRKVFDYLRDKNVEFFCYSATYARKVVDSINLLQKLFIIFISIILVGVVLYIFGYLKTIEKINRNLFSITIFNGFGLKSYLITEIKTVLIFALSIFIMNFIIYYSLYNIINLFLTNAFNIKIFIFNDNISTPFIGFGIIFIIIIVFYILFSFKKKNANILKLIH